MQFSGRNFNKFLDVIHAPALVFEDKFLYLDFTTEQIKLSKNPVNSERKKGPNWINYHIQDSFEGQRYLTGKIDKFIEDYK